MSPFIRWLRFNAVGAAGFTVQLLTLSLLSHVAHSHPLLLSAFATELAILQNFLLHLHFTWPERSARAHLVFRLLRFQTSTGCVSLLGTLAVVRPLVNAHLLALLPANLLSIALCSCINFFLAEYWSFRPAVNLA